MATIYSSKREFKSEKLPFISNLRDFKLTLCSLRLKDFLNINKQLC